MERRRIGLLEDAQRLVGEDDAEAEGVGCTVALEHDDLAGGVNLAH